MPTHGFQRSPRLFAWLQHNWLAWWNLRYRHAFLQLWWLIWGLIAQRILFACRRLVAGLVDTQTHRFELAYRLVLVHHIINQFIVLFDICWSQVFQPLILYSLVIVWNMPFLLLNCTLLKPTYRVLSSLWFQTLVELQACSQGFCMLFDGLLQLLLYWLLLYPLKLLVCLLFRNFIPLLLMILFEGITSKVGNNATIVSITCLKRQSMLLLLLLHLHSLISNFTALDSTLWLTVVSDCKVLGILMLVLLFLDFLKQIFLYLFWLHFLIKIYDSFLLIFGGFICRFCVVNFSCSTKAWIT